MPWGAQLPAPGFRGQPWPLLGSRAPLPSLLPGGWAGDHPARVELGRSPPAPLRCAHTLPTPGTRHPSGASSGSCGVPGQRTQTPHGLRLPAGVINFPEIVMTASGGPSDSGRPAAGATRGSCAGRGQQPARGWVLPTAQSPRSGSRTPTARQPPQSTPGSDPPGPGQLR